jgi:peptidylprolyl isomerase domain and WD repeat-containing protein 1
MTKTNFLLTGSKDGIIKFWKKNNINIEFVKKYKVFLIPIVDIVVSRDGNLACVSSEKNELVIFDIISFDLTHRFYISFNPGSLSFVHKKNSPSPLLAISSKVSSIIKIFNCDKIELNNLNEPIVNSYREINIHKYPVMHLEYNPKYHCCITIDNKSFVEIWNVDDKKKPFCLKFESKYTTDLFSFFKDQVYVTCLKISPNCKSFSTLDNMNKLRVFDFLSGKITLTIDESIMFYEEEQKVFNNK